MDHKSKYNKKRDYNISEEIDETINNKTNEYIYDKIKIKELKNKIKDEYFKLYKKVFPPLILYDNENINKEIYKDYKEYKFKIPDKIPDIEYLDYDCSYIDKIIKIYKDKLNINEINKSILKYNIYKKNITIDNKTEYNNLMRLYNYLKIENTINNKLLVNNNNTTVNKYRNINDNYNIEYNDNKNNIILLNKKKYKDKYIDKLDYNLKENINFDNNVNRIFKINKIINNNNIYNKCFNSYIKQRTDIAKKYAIYYSYKDIGIKNKELLNTLNTFIDDHKETIIKISLVYYQFIHNESIYYLTILFKYTGYRIYKDHIPKPFVKFQCNKNVSLKNKFYSIDSGKEHTEYIIFKKIDLINKYINNIEFTIYTNYLNKFL